MTHKDPERLEALEAKQTLINVALANIEKDWKELRLESKNNVLEMVIEQGVSVARASLLSGHHRNTIKVWLDVWNAEHKNDPK